MALPDPYIQSWFNDLSEFQSVCIDTSAGKLNLLAFANATILNYLPSAATQNNFLTAIAASTGYKDLQISDLTTYKTFRLLLDYSHPLENEVFNALQALSDPSVQDLA